MIIRLENKNDWTEVENLTREAFWNVYRPGCTEHMVVHNFRSDPAFVRELSIVAEEQKSKKIIAHIMYCKAIILSNSGQKKEILKQTKNKRLLIIPQKKKSLRNYC